MAKNHEIHKYYKTKLGDYTIYRCSLPGCAHYVPYELVLNRVSLCNKCGNEMVMTRAAARLAKPHCIACTKTKSKSDIPIDIKSLEDFITAVEGEK